MTKYKYNDICINILSCYTTDIDNPIKRIAKELE